MPRYRIESTAQVRRVYEVEAKDGAEADEKYERDECEMVHEEDVSEEADDVTEIKTPATAK